MPQEIPLIRFRFWKGPVHTHVRVYAATLGAYPGKAGDLTFRNEEWDALVTILRSSDGAASIEILPEEYNDPTGRQR